MKSLIFFFRLFDARRREIALSLLSPLSIAIMRLHASNNSA